MARLNSAVQYAVLKHAREHTSGGALLIMTCRAFRVGCIRDRKRMTDILAKKEEPG